MENKNQKTENNVDITNHLEEFRKMIKNEKKFPQTIPDVVLLRFLKVCDSNLAKAYELITLNFELRTETSILFTNRDVNSENIRTAYEVLQVCMMPSLTNDKLKVTIGVLKDTDSSRFTYTSSCKMGLMMFDARYLEYDTENNEIAAGEILVMDMMGASFGHFLSFLGSLSTARAFTRYFDEASPMKICQIHIVNPTMFVDKMFAIFRPFLSVELANAVHIHSSLESLHEFVSKEFLPTEYEGTSGLAMKDIHETSVKMMENKREYLLDDNNWRFSE